jgi:multiple sugar transport system substrate-binding protein
MAIAAGSPHKKAAYDFLRFLSLQEIDREVVRHGVVGVRLSTWNDSEIRRTVPAFTRIEAISLGARRLPRSPHMAEFAEIVDRIVVDALRTEEPSDSILKRAQRNAVKKNIRFQ